MSSTHNYRVAKPAQRTPTCDVCKSRHQKCSGEQSGCSNCKLRGISCSYSTRTRVPATRTPPELPLAAPFVPGPSLGRDLTNRPYRLSRPSISDTDYDRLYSEIFSDIVCCIQY